MMLNRISLIGLIGVACCLLAGGRLVAAETSSAAKHTFEIGKTDFLIDSKPFVIRSGELHAPRVPNEYWRHRLQMVKAMGCNTVCAYLFWNMHEPRPGEFDFTGPADAAEYCRIAQEVGLWVILRPGPYSCAEWEFGGFPWWLLKTPDIKLRTRDPRYLDAAKRYLKRVGQELAPLQVTRGGPILMVQVENEYGSYGNDREYIGEVRGALKSAGFEVPLFTCDGPVQLKNDTLPDLFSVVNFGGDPEGSFKALREIRAEGPLMCGEYYPGWFDSWGRAHHTGDAKRIASELGYMLEHRQSFSIYMVHGGTSFGFYTGANSPPFAPQSTSYDYDAPIDEAGRATPKFNVLRELFGKHLQAAETLPPVPAANPIIRIPEITFKESAPLMANLGAGRDFPKPPTMEMCDQPQGAMLYRTSLPAGPAATLTIKDVHDIAQVYLDGKRVGVIDRRFRRNTVSLPERTAACQLDILVEAMGRVNYGGHLHDRKGITESVQLDAGQGASELTGWNVFSLPFDAPFMAGLKYTPAAQPAAAPAVYRATFELTETGDTFLDTRTWTKGMVWINGHNLGRYWNIGPQQTLYLPGCWLKKGKNEILVLDILGGAEKLAVVGLDAPILDQVRPDPFNPVKPRPQGQALKLGDIKPIHEGTFPPGNEWQKVTFGKPATGRYLCIEALNSHSNDAYTSCAEINVLDEQGNELPRTAMSVVYADSEETQGDDGAASNVLDLQPTSFWHTEWQDKQPRHPHQLVIDLGAERTVSAIRYLPRQENPNGRIKDFRIFLSSKPFPGMQAGQ